MAVPENMKSADEIAETKAPSKPPPELRSAWIETKEIYQQVRADPSNPKLKGRFTHALYRERESLGGKNLIQALARLKVAKALRVPHNKPDNRPGRRTKVIADHMEWRNVETFITNQVLDKRGLSDRFKVDESATDWATENHAVSDKLGSGKSAANIETYISNIINNEIVAYLFSLAGNNDTGREGYPDGVTVFDIEDVHAESDESGAADDTHLEHEDDEDAQETVFAPVNRNEAARQFMPTLANDIQKNIFWHHVMLEQPLDKVSKLLHIGDKTCKRHVEDIRKAFIKYLRSEHR